jgi:hypothetical protein
MSSGAMPSIGNLDHRTLAATALQLVYILRIEII